MSTRIIPLDYVNNLMYELEKAFWDERGRGARFRMTTVGREFYKEKVASLLGEPDLTRILAVIKEVLVKEGLVGSVTYDQDERLMRVRVEGCLHLPVEEKMISRGAEPCACVPANLIVLAIEDKLKRPVELAEIKIVDGACQLLLVLFDHLPSLE
jgi:hypothetical protein